MAARFVTGSTGPADLSKFTMQVAPKVNVPKEILLTCCVNSRQVAVGYLLEFLQLRPV